MTNLVGQTLGGYAVLEQLGVGGMGAVFKARQPVLDRIVALKVIAPQVAQDAEYVARFRHEAKAAAQVNHPNIVQVYAAGEDAGTHFMVTEFVEGETLQQRLDREGRMDPQEAIAICVYLAEGLDHAWREAKLIHRDIKPANIFLSNKGAVKLGDMGLAKSVGGEAAASVLTQSGMTVGTPHYCSPEQAQAAKDTDFRADIYSLGCTLYHMLSGQLPYPSSAGESAMSVMVKQITQPPPVILKVLPTCPMPVVLLLKKMLAKQPSGRHLSYQELIADLTRIHGQLSQPQVARPISSSQPAGAPAEKKPLAMVYAAAVGVAVLLMVGLFVWAPWKSKEAGPAILAEPPAPVTVPLMGKEKEEVKGTLPASPPPVASTAPAVKKSEISPVDDTFVKEVAALPPEEQVKRVVAKLKQLNPEFDGGETHKIENDAVTELSFSTVGVTDISALKTLKWLKKLVIVPQTVNRRGGALADLAPLQGLALTWLWCHGNPISDLSPLRGMPLTVLNFSSTQVSDLSPLTGMKLTILGFVGTPVHDLTPLQSSPLEELGCSGSQVGDLTPVKNLPLRVLLCEATKVTDATALRDMPLRELRWTFSPERDTEAILAIKTLEKINGVPVAEFWKNVDPELVAKAKAAALPAQSPAVVQPSTFDSQLSAIAALPADKQIAAILAKLKELNPNFDGKETHKIENGAVTELSFSTAGVTDISPLKALKWLKKLVIAPSTLNQKGALADLAPLQGLPLTWLWCHNNPINDLTPLRGMPLTVLSFSGTQVGDLSPLNGMKLTILSFSDTPVADLAPLEDMPLSVLWCNNTKVTDLSPLKAMPLQELKCDFVSERDAAVLRGIKTLAKINDMPAGTFWMRVGRVVGRVPSPGAAVATRTPGQGTVPVTLSPAATAKAQTGQPFVSSIGMELLYIPPGEFLMGSTPEERAWAVANGMTEYVVKREGEAPRKTRIKDGFWLGRTEVTVGQWKQFVAATGYKTDAEKKGYADHAPRKGQPWGRVDGLSWRDPGFGSAPQDRDAVSCISWDDAVAFCEWLMEQERKAGRLASGQVVRLPTEAEWVYACRAGKQTKFCWGDTKESGEGRLNWSGTADGFEFVSPVDHYGSRGRNKFGLADMLGNVYEWCLDEFDAKQAHEECHKGNPGARVLRGGSFAYGPDVDRCAFRHCDPPAYSVSFFGFRVAVGADLSGAKTATSSTSPVADRPAPQLLSPANGAAIIGNTEPEQKDNLVVWEFAWSPVPGASRYQFYVKGSRATGPLIDQEVAGCSYRHESRSWFHESNRKGWEWKVRAWVRDDWSDWSETRTFDVGPR